MFMGAIVNILSVKKFLPFFIEKMDRNEACGTPENGDYACLFFCKISIFHSNRCFSLVGSKSDKLSYPYYYPHESFCTHE